MTIPGVKDPAAKHAESTVLAVCCGLAVLAATAVTLADHLGAAWAGQDRRALPVNPAIMVLTLALGRTAWPMQATVVLAAEAIVIIAPAAWAVWWWRHRTHRTVAIDAVASLLGHGHDLDALTESAVRATAARLKVAMPDDRVPGFSIGVGVVDNTTVYSNVEQLCLDIWGPRQGKSTSRIVPAIWEAPGPVLATSNKRDIVDDTRGFREDTGTCYVFDPQAVAGAHPSWYWDPLSTVRNEVQALELAAHFADGDDGRAAKADPFFDPEGESLLAGLYLAAAMEHKPITQAYRWVTDQTNQEPVRILERHGWEMMARGLSDQYNADPRQRSGVFATAKLMARSLLLTSIRSWVEPTGENRTALDVEQFVRSRDTLYLLSLEGAGSAGPLVSALTAAVMETAMAAGATSPMGRLPVPLLAALDEAANVVRWRDLPKRYSHFGSRGILVMTILQSWAQGQRCWGEEGIDALWSAASVRVLGPGVDDVDFLGRRAQTIGDHWELSGTLSRSSSGRSLSWVRQKQPTATVASLTALPKGRAVVWVAAAPPFVIKTMPWYRRPDMAADVRASQQKYDPSMVAQQPQREGMTR